jgi:pimeloyl-ACP methyl ester carboxylesterase
MLVGHSASDDLVASVRTAIRAQPAGTLAARLRSVLAVDAREALGRCMAPITYLRGTDDRVVSEASVAEVERASSTPVCIVGMRGPHLLLQAAPDEAWRALEAVTKQ